jgi:hypothetical protein
LDVNTVPGMSGNQGLSTVAVKFAGSMGPEPRANEGAADDGAGGMGHDVGEAGAEGAAAMADTAGVLEGDWDACPQPPTRTPATRIVNHRRLDIAHLLGIDGDESARRSLRGR